MSNEQVTPDVTKPAEKVAEHKFDLTDLMNVHKGAATTAQNPKQQSFNKSPAAIAQRFGQATGAKTAYEPLTKRMQTAAKVAAKAHEDLPDLSIGGTGRMSIYYKLTNTWIRFSTARDCKLAFNFITDILDHAKAKPKK